MKEIIKKIQDAQTRCKKQNGLSYCKNCGLNFKDFEKILIHQSLKIISEAYELGKQSMASGLIGKSLGKRKLNKFKEGIGLDETN